MARITLFLQLLLCITVGIYAQSPGGVSSPELWFKTLPAGTNLNGNYRWVDFGGDSLRLNDYDASGALAGVEYTTSTFRSYNGYPAISLDKLLDTKTREVMLKRTNLSQATVFGVFAPSANFNSEMLLYGLNGRNGQGIWLSTDKIYPSVQSGKSAFNYGETEGMDLMYAPGDIEPDVNTFREHSMSIVAYYRSIKPSTGIWGERDRAVFSFGYYKSNNANNTSTFNIPTAANRQFSGYAPEFIAYNRLLTPLERSCVDTYLAVKYGLTLPVSYIGSQGELLWDYAANPDFNNRITALYRDDASGLIQKESSTSYEEGPYYTDANDYYYQNSPNNRTSSSRLLVIGRGYGNTLADGSYMFWGDNNKSISLQDMEGIFGRRIMGRQWLLKTNIINAPESARTLNWTVQNLNFNTKGFESTVEKTVSAGEELKTGYAYTQTPLIGSDGYIGISYSSLSGSSTYLKFGGQGFSTTGDYDYGYYIAPDYKVYPIIKGVVSENSFTILILTSRLELEKRGNKIFLRIDGSRNNNSEITISPEDANRAWYGSLAVTQGVLSTSFKLRHGGFTDTGNRVELSYAANRASAFKDNDQGTSYLVIDRTGAGNFNAPTVEYIAADEIDATRQKVIFNNVFFDTDGNGEDAFTFVYGAPGITGDIEVVNPTCEASDGEAIVRIATGSPAFNYTLTNTETGAVVKSGKENSRTIHLTGLPAGDYELNVSETGGFSFESTSASGVPTRAKTTNFLPVFEGSLEWTVSSITDTYMVGYTTIAEDVNSTKNIMHYGLKKQGSALYKVLNGKLTALGISVVPGDILKVAKTMSGITYYKNGAQIGTASIGFLDYLLKFYGLIEMSEGPAKILNVNAAGFFNLLDYRWSSTSNATLSGSADNSSITYPVHLEDPCEPHHSIAMPTAIEAPAVKADILKVSYRKGSLHVKAEIEFEKPDVVSFVVYNMNGQIVRQISRNAPHKTQSADIHLPASGSYIIKAITLHNGEHTKKLIAQ